MEFLSSLRSFFATIDIFIANLIGKVYSLILQIADVNIVNKSVEDVISRVYSVVGLFMLFKLVLVIINYIIDPDKQQSASKIVVKVIVALVLIPTVPAIFTKAYELQGIILKENLIGNIILGNGGGAKKETFEKIGNEVSYLVFSNFLDYNDTDGLELIFKDCPNIFLEEDNTQNRLAVPFCLMPDVPPPQIPLCGYYLYYPATKNPAYGMPDGDGNYPDSRDLYYACKSGYDLNITEFPPWTMYCGIRDGKYIYDLINKGREERSVSTIMSPEIITAIESDPVFYDGSEGHTCNPETEKLSDGDFVFEYNFLLATLVGLIVIFLLIVICVDISIRSVKLAFLQVISPIPIVSYVDIKDSKLFNSWLKETITTYLQLFIRLAIVFFTVLLFKELLKTNASNDILVNIFIIIGILLFAFQMPKLLCELFNLNKEHGFLSLIKDVGKFAIGATAIGVSAVGGTAANIAATPANINSAKDGLANAKNNLKNFKTNMGAANGALGKLGVFGSTVKSVAGVPISIVKIPGSIVAGGVSSSVRTAKKLAENKGNYKPGDVTSSIRESSMNREARRMGTFGMSQDELKSQISELENRQSFLQTSYEQEQEILSNSLAAETNSADIQRAFQEHYDSYSDYVSNLTTGGEASHIISEDKYNSYNELYTKQEEMQNELDEIESKLKQFNKYVKEK